MNKNQEDQKTNNEKDKTRCFISINIPQRVAEKVKEIQYKLPEFRGKKTEKENLHLTLKFLGEISNEEIENVKSILRNIQYKKFNLKINNIGVFSLKFIKIIWLHLIGAEELQKKIDKEISENLRGFEKEKRFMSHLTISRVKSLKNKKEFLRSLDNLEIPEISFTVKDFCLMSSELKSSGVEHNMIERFELND